MSVGNVRSEKKSFEELVQLMAKLRAPGGCPWDREQRLTDLKRFIIEEAYEVVDAIDSGDAGSLREEVGDLLFQSVFVAEIASETGLFDIGDSVTAIYDKLVRRHPHVFGDVKAETADAVLMNWEKLKSEEPANREKSLLAGVPESMPGLLKAIRLTEKAARVGFDWEKVDDVFVKLDEELGELRAAVATGDESGIEEELGDLLFTACNLARRLKVDAEAALQKTNRKFRTRFESIEKKLRERNRTFEETTLAELDAMWDEAKSEVD